VPDPLQRTGNDERGQRHVADTRRDWAERRIAWYARAD
jgi:hypothetical protein